MKNFQFLFAVFVFPFFADAIGGSTIGFFNFSNFEFSTLRPIVFPPGRRPSQDQPPDRILNYTLPKISPPSSSNSNSSFNINISSPEVSTLRPIVFPPGRPTKDQPFNYTIPTISFSSNSSFNLNISEISSPQSPVRTTSFHGNTKPKIPLKPQENIFTGICDAGETCHDSRFLPDEFNTTLKRCSGKCVYYKCLIKGDGFEDKDKSFNVKEGYGCMHDFVNTCMFTGYQMKNQLENDGPNHFYRDENLIFLSCHTENGCAKEKIEKMKEKDPTIDKNFGGQNVNKKAFMIMCFNFWATNYHSMHFDTKAWCKSGKQFLSNENVKDRATKYKSCPNIISFMCTSDGKVVKGGIGCIEDIKIACKGILSKKIEKMLDQNYFFHADKNIIVSVSRGLFGKDDLGYYLKINSKLIKPFYDNIDKHSDELCDYQKPKTLKNSSNSIERSDSSYAMMSHNFAIHGTTVKLQRQHIFGLALIYILCKFFL